MTSAAARSTSPPPWRGSSRPRTERGSWLAVAERPDIGGDGRDLVLREIGAAHRRHRAGRLLGLGDSLPDRSGEPGEASVAPEPMAAREVGTLRRALAGRAVAGRAGPAVRAMIDALAERYLPRAGAGRRR